MKLASLGHAARNNAAIKVRQPLSEVAFSVGQVHEADVIGKYAAVLQDELNVKAVRVLGSAGEAVSYALNPLPRQLGQKYESLFPQVRKALLALDAGEAGKALLEGQPVQVSVNGKTYEILPDEIEVRAQARSGLETAQEGAYLAALSTEIDEALMLEGLAREFVRNVQDLRKQFNFDIADRIEVTYQASDTLKHAVQAHKDYIMGEVLAVELVEAMPEKGAHQLDEPLSFEGQQVTLGLKKA
jgi:isoleucyl-tRNA synthetase